MPHPADKGRVLALLALTQFMIVIDASVTNVALPSIGDSLKIDQADLSWIVNAYGLTFGGFLLLGGRLADLLGRRRMFMAGIGLFGVASLLGGLSQSLGFLVFARGLQGLGAALASPAALSIVTTTFTEGSERNRALGIWGAVGGAGGAAGVLLGGVLTEIDWRLVLFINVPVAVAVVLLAPRILAESRADTDVNSFDVPGAVTVTAGLALLVYALVDAEKSGWSSGTTIGRLVGAAALLAVFVAIEMRARHPLVPFSIFRLRTLRGANVVGLFIGMSLLSMFYVLSLYLQRVLGMSALEAGLSYLPLAITIILTAGAASQMVTRIGFKPTLVFGLVLVAAGLAWFTQISADGSLWADMLGPSILAGAGLGFSFVPVTIAAVTGIDPHEAGLASGLINTSQQLGGALGVAVLVSVASSRILDFGGAASSPEALTSGYRLAFLVGMFFAIAGAIMTLVMISSRDSREHSAAARAGEVEAVAV